MRAAAWGMSRLNNPVDRKVEDDLDRHLIQGVARNLDRLAFAELFDRLAPRVKSFILYKGATPELAEDLVQEAMISVWTKAGLYDPTKGTVKTWVFTIARNLRIDRMRRESSMPLTDLGDYDAESDEPRSDDVLMRKQDGDLIARALRDIPAEQKEVLTLSFFEDVPQSEIAQRLNLPVGTVKSRMRLAYGRLRKCLETSL